MKVSELDFKYPEELVATEPRRPSRVMWVRNGQPQELSKADFLNQFREHDTLVLNDTRVLKRRVFAGDLEILFLKETNPGEWEVLFPSRKFAVGSEFQLPEDVTMTLVEKGRPQKVKLSQAVDETYFQRVAELPLPPYIQKAREAHGGGRHNVAADESWYQTAWAQNPGSFAAPTASLHLTQDDLDLLKNRGVSIHKLTLHVGLGTFLPVLAEDLDDHDMHSEYVEISAETWKAVDPTQKSNRQGRVFSLGTTVTRALESAALEKIPRAADGGFCGFTNLLIQPGYKFQVIDILLTNFHQPKSTLLALVSAFAGLENVRACYLWAIERKFRLFSYGDLSVWEN